MIDRLLDKIRKRIMATAGTWRRLRVPAAGMLSLLLAFPAGEAGAVDTGCDARQAFVHLPIGVLDILPASTREDMLTYFEADSVWQAPNVMGGVSTLSAATPEYLEVKVSDVSLLQIKRLPYKGGCLYMTVYTVGGEGSAPDSELKFYSPAMQELPREKFMRMPRLSDFLTVTKGSKESLASLGQLVAFPTYRFAITPGDDRMKADLTVGEYMTKEDYDTLRPYIRPGGVTYVWTGTRFRRDDK